MHVTVLSENTSSGEEDRKMHGVSLYVRTLEHRILFNLGDGAEYKETAVKCGINLQEADIVIISGTGQYESASDFLTMNNDAHLYISESLYKEYRELLGLVRDKGRIHYVSEALEVDEEISLFSEVPTVHQAAGLKGPEELHMIVREQEKRCLFINHGYQGAVNILEEAELRCGNLMRAVVGGFYFYNVRMKEYEEDSFITLVVSLIKKKNTVFFTCHESRDKAYGQLKDFIQENMNMLYKEGEVEV